MSIRVRSHILWLLGLLVALALGLLCLFLFDAARPPSTHGLRRPEGQIERPASIVDGRGFSRAPATSEIQDQPSQKDLRELWVLGAGILHKLGSPRFAWISEVEWSALGGAGESVRLDSLLNNDHDQARFSLEMTRLLAAGPIEEVQADRYVGLAKMNYAAYHGARIVDALLNSGSNAHVLAAISIARWQWDSALADPTSKEVDLALQVIQSFGDRPVMAARPLFVEGARLLDSDLSHGRLAELSAAALKQLARLDDEEGVLVLEALLDSGSEPARQVALQSLAEAAPELASDGKTAQAFHNWAIAEHQRATTGGATWKAALSIVALSGYEALPYLGQVPPEQLEGWQLTYWLEALALTARRDETGHALALVREELRRLEETPLVDCRKLYQALIDIGEPEDRVWLAGRIRNAASNAEVVALIDLLPPNTWNGKELDLLAALQKAGLREEENDLSLNVVQVAVLNALAETPDGAQIIAGIDSSQDARLTRMIEGYLDRLTQDESLEAGVQYLAKLGEGEPCAALAQLASDWMRVRQTKLRRMAGRLISEAARKCQVGIQCLEVSLSSTDWPLDLRVLIAGELVRSPCDDRFATLHQVLPALVDESKQTESSHLQRVLLEMVAAMAVIDGWEGRRTAEKCFERLGGDESVLHPQSAPILDELELFIAKANAMGAPRLVRVPAKIPSSRSD